MIDVVRETMAAELLLIEQEFDTTTAVLGYGRDVSCTFDVDAQWSEVDAEDPLSIVNASVRRLITERGTNPDDPNYGLNIPGYLSKPLTPSGIEEIQGLAKLELEKDDRVFAATVRVLFTGVKTLAVLVRLELNNPSVKVPEFTLRLTPGSVALEVSGT